MSFFCVCGYYVKKKKKGEEEEEEEEEKPIPAGRHGSIQDFFFFVPVDCLSFWGVIGNPFAY